ncbi:sugar ABC transporter substrate-binding protein [Gracilibacillus caseinilyticus]|uniref:Sugar ABC transporter substrate-binding protein n=1 Tax=Gracilibacillus caseinilyticus TaxID=2932256 RepID=A0ABY4F3A0_9BACI|nr:sugar ABC transporter substrate-binding protein [Gracilibacillus caseinilyticus]UOQ50354.1 sugar ABC transporter substrate-binding protein [Gracilibacillus caseinilyticus]
MKKLPINSFLFMIGFILFLVGCSNDTETSNSTDDSGGETVNLTMQAWGNPEELKVYQRAIDGFMGENPNIKVDLVSVASDQYEQKLMTSLQGSKGPDIFYAYEPTMPELIDAGVVQPLDDFFASDESYASLDDFSEGLFGPARSDDVTYGITPDANPMVIYYNKKVFEEAGAKSPQEYYDEGNWNWDAFLEVSEKIKESGKTGLVMENWWAHWYSWVWSNDGLIFDENGEVVLQENDKAKEAFHFMHDLVQSEKAVYAGSLPQGQGVDAMFMSNQVGMIAGGRWFTPQFDQNKALEYDYIPFPTNTGNKVEEVGVPVAYLAVNSKNDHVEEAMKFVSYYVSTAGQEVRTGEGGSALPSINTINSEALADTTDKHIEYMFNAREDGFTHGSNLAKDAHYPGLNTDITETIDLMFLGKQDADTTIDKVVEVIQEHTK